MSAHRFWRLTRFKHSFNALSPYSSLVQGGQLRFETAEGVLSDNPSLATASGTRTPNIENAFRWSDSPSKLYALNSSPAPYEEAWLQYSFETPVTVTAVWARFPQAYLPISTPSFWDSATLQYSDDGVVWTTKSLVVFPKRYYSWKGEVWVPSFFAEEDSSNLRNVMARAKYFSKSTRTPEFLSMRGVQVEAKITPYDEWLDPDRVIADTFKGLIGRGVHGYIRGTVYERVGLTPVKKPVKRKVFLLHQETATLVLSKWSKDDGTFLFRNLDPDTEFVLYAIDHTKQWGLEGSAFRKPKLRTYDGVSIQYPTE